MRGWLWLRRHLRVSSRTPAPELMVIEYLQSQEPLEDGTVPGVCDHYENLPCHHLIRLQGSSGDLRPVHGNRCIFWQDGGDFGPSSSWTVPAREILPGMWTRHTVYHAWYLRLPWRWSSTQRHHAYHRLGGGHHVRVDRGSGVHPSHHGKSDLGRSWSPDDLKAYRLW